MRTLSLAWTESVYKHDAEENMPDLKREKGTTLCNEELRSLWKYMNIAMILYFNIPCGLITYTHTNLSLLFTSVMM
jgi:hypothetical protein